MADQNLSVGNIHDNRGNIPEGYTPEQVSILVTELTSTLQPKPFDGRCPYKGFEVFEEEEARPDQPVCPRSGGTLRRPPVRQGREMATDRPLRVGDLFLFSGELSTAPAKINAIMSSGIVLSLA
jgi:hypothetical protein